MKPKLQIERDLFFIETAGTGDQIGQQYGDALKQQIVHQVEGSLATLGERFEESIIASTIECVSTTFRQNYPYLWDEITGICTGAEMALQDYLRHLFKSAIPVFDQDNEGCTDIIFPVSKDGPLLGKTHDATSTKRGPAVVRKTHPEGYYAVICVTGVDGLTTMTGLNDQGLAIGEASIHFHTSNRKGTVRNLLPRAILHECADVHEAVEFLAVHPPLRFGYQFALVDEGGNSAIVERSPVDQSVRRSDGTALFCTNHTVTPATRALEKSRGELGDRNSDTRYKNLETITADSRFRPSLQTMKEVLRFHHEFAGICQHGDSAYTGPKLEFYPMFTQRAFINMVQTRTLLMSNGNPCESKFIEFSMNQ